MEDELKEVMDKLSYMIDPSYGYTLSQIRNTSAYQTQKSYRSQVDKWFRLLTRKKELILSIEGLSRARMRARHAHIVAESSEMSEGMPDPSTTDTRENVSEILGNKESSIGKTYGDMIANGQINLLDMSDFLSRPVLLASLEFKVGENLDYNIDLWDAFTLVPSIRAKLKNYAFLRGNMNVQISISGTPFHFSKVMVSYQPWASENFALSRAVDLSSAYRKALLTYLSQSPESGIMDVKENTPLHIVCPYISPAPMIRLFNSSASVISDVTTFNDTFGFGHLFIRSITPLGCVSSTPSNVSILIYMWMTEVELGTTTGTVTAISTESDEREIGPIERFASNASGIAKIASQIPTIGLYAKASSIVLKAVAKASALFGWSYPVMNNEPSRVKNEPYQNGANTIGYNTSKRITLDPKQELTVDPRICAVDTDDMAISTIVARESYLDSFAWQETDVPMASNIWAVPVHPMLQQKLIDDTLAYYFPTALAFAAAPFGWWRGDIEFKIEIVCSSFHRGKLAIYFEPNISQSVQIDTVLNLNKQYLQILDIQECQEMTYVVHWAHVRSWARMPMITDLYEINDPLALTDQLAEIANGYIAVVPFTQLQSPDGSSVWINVYVKSENMMFNYLNSSRLPSLRPIVESAEIEDDFKCCKVSLNQSSATEDNIALHHFGEVPLSFRSLTKRFCGWLETKEWEVEDGMAGNDHCFYQCPIYPPPYPDYVGTVVSPTKNLIPYLRYAYVGIKGGLKHRIGLHGDYTFRHLDRIKVNLNPAALTETHQFKTNNNLQQLNSVLNGTVEYIPTTNGGVEFEIPFYSNNLFGLSFSDNPFPVTCYPLDLVLVRDFYVVFPMPTFTLSNLYLTHDIASAEDFSLIRFQGAPCWAAPEP